MSAVLSPTGMQWRSDARPRDRADPTYAEFYLGRTLGANVVRELEQLVGPIPNAAGLKVRVANLIAQELARRAEVLGPSATERAVAELRGGEVLS